MSPSQNFWNSLTNSEKMSDWWQWLNTKGDDSDTVSFINKELKRAIKVIYEKNDQYPYSIWVEKFSDDPQHPEDTVEVLVVTYKDSAAALSVVKKLISNWKSKDCSYTEIQTSIDNL